MQTLLKRLYNYTFGGTSRVPSNSTVNVESGGTLNCKTGSTVKIPAGFTLGGTALTATVSELNTSVAGLLATSAEINKATDVSTRIVNTTATTLTVTAAAHGGRLVTVNSAAPIAVTLPAASGSGEIYTFVIGTAATATAHTIKVANTTDIIAGVSIIAQTDTAQVNGFLTSATSDTVTLNGTTQGGKVGDEVKITDIASGVFEVLVRGGASGTVVTPFSATV